MTAPDAWRTLYPFRSKFMMLGSLRYHYLDEGVGEPLLMVHGNPTWSFYWRNLVTGLRDQHRVIAVDHIGCGLSDKPQSYPYTLRQHTANLLKLIDELDLSGVTLLAHDWGGAIGLGAVVQRPERFGRLILFNTGAFPPPLVPWRIRVCRTPLLGPLAIRYFNVFARAALTMAVERPERMTAAVRQGLLAPYDSWAHRVAICRFVQDIPFTRHHQTWATLQSLEEQLRHLPPCPVHLLWGMKDWCFTPACLQRMIEILPEADVHRFPDAGHYVVEDESEPIVSLVRQFLAVAAAEKND